jgi:hypothetical protein
MYGNPHLQTIVLKVYPSFPAGCASFARAAPYSAKKAATSSGEELNGSLAEAREEYWAQCAHALPTWCMIYGMDN